ncbi:MAG: right-handed parallel beta-helix repeat-containing protein [Aquabacterium sp.]
MFIFEVNAEVRNPTNSCITIERMRDGNYPAAYIYDAFRIEKPGQYCLMENIIARRILAISEGGEKNRSGAIGWISTSDVNLDLKGHQIIAETAGMWAIDAGNNANELIKNIAIRNGIIESKTSWGIQFINAFKWDLTTPKEEFFKTSQRVPRLRYIDEDDYKKFLAQKKQLQTIFPQTKHFIENLTINSFYRAVNIRGGGNTIKNCRIRINGHTTGIDLSGPNQIIEGNHITVKSEMGQGAPIVLKMADNSIIRNNVIVIETGGGSTDAAINIIASKNVVIENNKIVGAKMIYKTNYNEFEKKSAVIERGNEFASNLDAFILK